MTENTMAAGSNDLAPNRVKLKRASKERTTPVAAPAKATSGRDLDPISSSCRNSSRNSNGGVTAARTTRQKNIPRSPNHSKNFVIKPRAERDALRTSVSAVPANEGSVPDAAPISREVTGLDPDAVRHANCSGACEKARSGARYI